MEMQVGVHLNADESADVRFLSLFFILSFRFNLNERVNLQIFYFLLFLLGPL